MFRPLHVAFLLAFVIGCGNRPAPEPVVLGMVQPLTGPDRARGEEARRAVQLAVEELLAAEVRVGGREVVFQHADGGDAASVRAETVRLLAVNRVPGLLGALAPTPAEAFFREARLMSAPAVLAGEVPTPPAGEGLLALGAGPSARARALARYVRETLKPARAAIVVDENDPTAVVFAGAFAQALRAAPALSFDEVRFAKAETRDAALKQAADKMPEAVLLALPPGDQAAARGKLRDAGYAGPTLAGGADDEANLDGDAPHYRVTVFAGTDLTAAGQGFVKKYRDRFGVEPGVTAALSWEAARLLAETMSKGDSAGPLKLRELLTAGPEFEGITGPVTFPERQAKRKLFVVRQAGQERTVTPLE